MPSELMQYHEVPWGIQQCRGRKQCQKLADLLYDWLPLCLDCADNLLQRENAIGLEPRMRELLPDFRDDM